MYYLDGLASWPMRPEAKDALIEALAQPGNANSNHVAGWQASSLYEKGRRAVADLIGAAPNEIFITSGATEANALAIIGAARTLAGQVPSRNKIILSALEHDAVRRPAEALRELGFEVPVCPVGASGSICLESLEALPEVLGSFRFPFSIGSGTGSTSVFAFCSQNGGGISPQRVLELK